MNASAVFSLSNVSKVYTTGMWRKRSEVLSEISLDVQAGETVGFIGHNGAGKSSTIRIMLGLQAPTSGTALIRGQDAAQSEARRGVAYLPEVPLIYDYMTPRELVSMSLRLHGYSKDVPAQCRLWLEKLGVDHVANKLVRGFSKGMTQRVALAMAMCSDPSVLVLDEPLSGLDPIGRREIVDLLADYRSRGNTLFFSSHVLSDVERLADRFLFIHHGKIKASHSVSSVLKAASNLYELVMYSEVALDGFEPVGRHLWRCSVGIEALPGTISETLQLGALLHSVRSAASIEQLYLHLVGEFSAKEHQGK